MKMISRSLALAMTLIFTLLLAALLSGCRAECEPETIQVTRILERRVIEKVLVTVEVTRIHRVVETPKPTAAGVVPPQGDDATPPASDSSSTTATPATPTPSPPATAAPVSPRVTSTAVTSTARTRRLGEELLTATRDAEQTLLALQQALNSAPLPIDVTIEMYGVLGDAPTFSIPEGEVELQSFYIRYREQIDHALVQATDLLTHLVEIQGGQAVQTEIRPTELSLARDAASASTSTIQGLIRELETYLASPP
jgi:hypothetical protein